MQIQPRDRYLLTRSLQGMKERARLCDIPLRSCPVAVAVAVAVAVHHGEASEGLKYSERQYWSSRTPEFRP